LSPRCGDFSIACSLVVEALSKRNELYCHYGTRFDARKLAEPTIIT